MNKDATVVEAMLLRWGDNQNGRTVTLLLPGDGDHPFRGLKCGPANGQRLALSVALIADDESQKPLAKEVNEKPRPPTASAPHSGGAHRSFHEMSAAQQAGILCNEASFIKFLNKSVLDELGWDWIDNSASAATAVRRLCHVESRTDIDKTPEAMAAWQRLVSDYRAWMREPEVV